MILNMKEPILYSNLDWWSQSTKKEFQYLFKETYLNLNNRYVKTPNNNTPSSN